ncbi:diguanylate cyclase [Sulfurimonas sp.]|nr:diguanylate cyclase [Sulfurimonas sp.]
MLFGLISRNSKHYYRFILTLIFLSVGLIISLVAVFTSGYLQVKSLEKEFISTSYNTAEYKKKYLEINNRKFKNYISAVDTIPEFRTFLESDKHNYSAAKKYVESIIMAITHSSPSIMQFRFIDENGHETIRVERKSTTDKPYLVESQYLQDKSERYYFQDTKNTKDNKLWYSNLDLNIEHGKIEKPIVPTLRIAKSYYVDNSFAGIMIINIFMQDILNELKTSNLFHVSLLDKNNNILVDNFANNTQEWSKYLSTEKDFKFRLKKNQNSLIFNFLFPNRSYTIQLDDIFNNNEGLKIVLESKHEQLLTHAHQLVEYMVIMLVMIFIISLPVILLISKYPIKLHNKVKDLNNDLQTKLDIIDKHVYISSTDMEGTITDVSSAFSALSGYTKDELIGDDHKALRDNELDSSIYEHMWSNILKGKEWSGELRNINKSGQQYWIKAYINPILKDNNIVGFTSVREDITDQKRVEELSIKDELTQAYNRRYFNEVFTQELKRAYRNKENLSIAMFDIDSFKKYNDTYGHLQGDVALQKVVKTVSSKLQRPTDYLFRIGGEEFIIIYSKMKNIEESIQFSENIVQSVADIHLEHKSSTTSKYVTISLGLLNITPECSMNDKEILKRIDELLYTSKNNGKNQANHEVC